MKISIDSRSRQASLAADSESIYAVGQTSSFGIGMTDALILKCDLAGNLIWAKAWGFEPPWLLAKSTHHPTVYHDPAGEGCIRNAIDELVNGGYGYHAVYGNIIDYLERVDLEEIRRRLGR